MLKLQKTNGVFAEKMFSPPLIPGIEGPGTRPYWSVMIPTYNPRAAYLEETLNSVLQQDPGPEQMQIEVVDDCSNDNTASEVTRRLGAGRVTFMPNRRTEVWPIIGISALSVPEVVGFIFFTRMTSCCRASMTFCVRRWSAARLARSSVDTRS